MCGFRGCIRKVHVFSQNNCCACLYCYRSYHYNPDYHVRGGYICPSGQSDPWPCSIGLIKKFLLLLKFCIIVQKYRVSEKWNSKDCILLSLFPLIVVLYNTIWLCIYLDILYGRPKRAVNVNGEWKESEDYIIRRKLNTAFSSQDFLVTVHPSIVRAAIRLALCLYYACLSAWSVCLSAWSVCP